MELHDIKFYENLFNGFLNWHLPIDRHDQGFLETFYCECTKNHPVRNQNPVVLFHNVRADTLKTNKKKDVSELYKMKYKVMMELVNILIELVSVDHLTGKLNIFQHEENYIH